MKQFAYVTIFFALANVQAQNIDITYDWNTTIQSIPEQAYGVNSPANFIPDYSENPIYMDNLELITQKKGLVRLHGWGMIDESSPESWLNNGVWNTTKIGLALTPLIEQGYQVMINIPSGAMGEDDYQDPIIFAQFCADLVKIVNINHQLGVTYWEIPNERELGFAEPGLSVADMSTLIKTAAQAMKAVDPTIEVGGAATAWVNISYLTDLVQMTPEIDFISCHTYSGDCTNELEDIYNIAQYAIQDLHTLRQNIDMISGANGLPIFLTEYNLSYQGCDLIQSYEGAVYDAIIMTESVKAGINGTFYWAIAPYSDMSIILGDIPDDNAYLYEAMNSYFQGDLVQHSSSDTSKVLVYSTINPNENHYSFSLINRTAATQSVNINMTGLSPGILNKYLWDAQNSFLLESTSWSALNNGAFTLSPYSVNLFTGTLNPLPIDLMTFEGVRLFDSHRLTWVTVSEIDAAHFEIELSNDGTNWQQIGIVNSLKNSKEEQRLYFFSHQSSSKSNYYRLKMVDLNGAFRYSKVLFLEGNFIKIEVFPNPTNHRLRLSNYHGTSPIQIYDTKGILMWHGKYNGKFIPLEDYPEGLYYLKIEQEIISFLVE